MLFPANIGPKLSIDEVEVTNCELYTVLTNKAAHGKKGALVGMCEGTKASEIAPILSQIPLEKRAAVKEITLDKSESMEAIVKRTFPNAVIVTDRFHVQQLISEALREVRIAFRWEAIKEENKKIRRARDEGKSYRPYIFSNGDTKKQLLARSRYLLFKTQSNWGKQQKERGEILFAEFPKIKEAYNLSMMFRTCYENSQNITEAKEELTQWYEKVKEKDFDSFITATESIRWRETTILNYFIDRSTNASAESFNAKLKDFRSIVRGVRDRAFHLFRVAKLYA
ncbi:MAG: transposase [Candidatus Doudnabacteria bacterium]|nr:transposase [Candidatus Doudnabacteria bacterium]